MGPSMSREPANFRMDPTKASALRALAFAAHPNVSQARHMPLFRKPSTTSHRCYDIQFAAPFLPLTTAARLQTRREPTLSQGTVRVTQVRPKAAQWSAHQ